MKNLLIAGGAIAALLFFLKRKKSAAENIIVEPIDIAIDSQRSSFSRIYYRIKLRLVNNEPANVNVSSINFAVTANGRAIGSINNTTGFRVDAGSSKEITLDASISSIGAIGLIRDLITEGFNIDILVAGTINTDLGAVNVNFSKSL
jgi:LEA14-like dessication related protein